MRSTKAGSPSILIVCDEDGQRTGGVLSVILRPFYQVEATSLHSFVQSERLRNHDEVEVVLYDLSSSRAGLEGLLPINHAYPRAKIVLLTPQSSPDLMATGVLHGVVGCVVYPFEAGAFVTWLHDLMGEE